MGPTTRVSTLDIKNPPLNDDGEVDFNKDFFGKETNLTEQGDTQVFYYVLIALFIIGLGKAMETAPTK